jgi:hypothetical protein
MRSGVPVQKARNEVISNGKWSTTYQEMEQPFFLQVSSPPVLRKQMGRKNFFSLSIDKK